MADKIRANYPAMEDMAKHCLQVSQRLEELAQTVDKIKEQLEGGVLQGQPGEAFGSALFLFSNKIIDVHNKIGEQYDGIRAAISDMQQADTAAAGDFN